MSELRALVSTMEQLIAEASRVTAELRAAVASAEEAGGQAVAAVARSAARVDVGGEAAGTTAGTRAGTPWSRKRGGAAGAGRPRVAETADSASSARVPENATVLRIPEARPIVGSGAPTRGAGTGPEPSAVAGAAPVDGKSRDREPVVEDAGRELPAVPRPAPPRPLPQPRADVPPGAVAGSERRPAPEVPPGPERRPAAEVPAGPERRPAAEVPAGPERPVVSGGPVHETRRPPRVSEFGLLSAGAGERRRGGPDSDATLGIGAAAGPGVSPVGSPVLPGAESVPAEAWGTGVAGPADTVDRSPAEAAGAADGPPGRPAPADPVPRHFSAEPGRPDPPSPPEAVEAAEAAEAQREEAVSEVRRPGLLLLAEPEITSAGAVAPDPPDSPVPPGGAVPLRLVGDSRPPGEPEPISGAEGRAAARMIGRVNSGTAGAIREMAIRHNLEIRGFDTHSVDADIGSEIIAAVDTLFAKYTVELYGIEIAEQREDTLRRERRKGVETGDSAPPRVWITLAWSELGDPAPDSGAGQGRKLFRRSDPAARPVYAAVVRAFGAALDEAGGHRARQEAWRILMTGSLGGGLNLGQGLLDPARALIDGFVEVELRGKRAGETAGMLHEALVKMIRANPEETSA